MSDSVEVNFLRDEPGTDDFTNYIYSVSNNDQEKVITVGAYKPNLERLMDNLDLARLENIEPNNFIVRFLAKDAIVKFQDCISGKSISSHINVLFGEHSPEDFEIIYKGDLPEVEFVVE